MLLKHTVFWKSIARPWQQVGKAATEIVSTDIKKKVLCECHAFRFQEEQAVKDKNQGDWMYSGEWIIKLGKYTSPCQPLAKEKSTIPGISALCLES